MEAVPGDDATIVAHATGEVSKERAMSYMRGEQYLWGDDTHLHLWVADGDDGWEESGWAQDRGEEASGVALPLDVVDELVVMRLAELVEAGTVAEVIERARTRHGGNGGCIALQQHAAGLKAALGRVPPA